MTGATEQQAGHLQRDVIGVIGRYAGLRQHDVGLAGERFNVRMAGSGCNARAQRNGRQFRPLRQCLAQGDAERCGVVQREVTDHHQQGIGGAVGLLMEGPQVFSP